jgi:lipid II:glycine glycyltransferase (peptidoglycan interpeptide bridge formation enzyme)
VALAKLRAYRRDPPAKFLHLAEALPTSLRVWIAYHAGVPVAGLIVLLGKNASYTRGAMDKERAGSLRANELLHWSAIREACDMGCRHYHLGETGGSAPLAQFKEKLGAEPVSYAELHFERLPIVRSHSAAKSLVKHAVGFRDA